jgi:ribose transport system ATP-binding protein
MSVRENITLTHLAKLAHGGVVDGRSERAEVAEVVGRLNIRPRDSEIEAKSLSGGNQQKVVFAKWLEIAPKVLFLDEPTRGVDVGGKAEIYQIINELAAGGVAIVMASSELPEVLSMSDRILVMHQGRQAGIVDAKTATQETIMHAAAGGL